LEVFTNIEKRRLGAVTLDLFLIYKNSFRIKLMAQIYMAASSVKFEGKGPFYIRTVEHATANALADTIQLTLYVLADEQEPTLVRIETQMTSGAAEELAITLTRALDETVQEIGS
jgi:hypothetical protein